MQSSSLADTCIACNLLSSPVRLSSNLLRVLPGVLIAGSMMGLSRRLRRKNFAFCTQRACDLQNSGAEWCWKVNCYQHGALAATHGPALVSPAVSFGRLAFGQLVSQTKPQEALARAICDT